MEEFMKKIGTAYQEKLIEATNCEHCRKELKSGSKIWFVEMKNKTGNFHIAPIADKDSQGWFPVGAGCFEEIRKQKQNVNAE